MARRRGGRTLNGWLVIDKPAGPTSAAIVARVRRATQAARVGHAGTLDPLAKGVLPIALGEATKTVAYAMDAGKSYRFTIRWGEARTTDDADGAVTAESEVRPGTDAIRAALAAFTGVIDQRPPAYSALKVDGVRAYVLARADQPPHLPARAVRIDRIALIGVPDPDHAEFDVRCGKGAYMRSLARDIARHLGTLGHVAALRRLAVGRFTEDQAISLERLDAVGHSAALRECLLPVATALDDIPALALTEMEAERLRHGRAVQVLRDRDRTRIGALGDGAIVCATAAGIPVALSRVDGAQIRPVRVLNL